MAFDNSQQGSVFNSRRDGDDSRVFKRVDIRRDDPELKAIVDKLVAPLEKHGQQRVGANREIKAPDSSLIQRISDETAQNLNDATSMMQLLPDLELAKLILVSTILSPKDMGKVELNFSVDSNVFKNELSGMMLECIRHHFENVYKISDNLTTILEDVLFDKGSHPVLILPESSIDDLINSPSRVTMESISDDIDVRTKSRSFERVAR
mgnify:CR=1 FL=1